MRFKSVILLFLPVCALASPGYHLPWGKDADLRTPSTTQIDPGYSLGIRAATQLIYFHQQVLSPVDGPRSHFRPSSSNYMLQAMQRHGFLQGFFMGCDRLMRENSDAWVYRKIEEDGKLFKHDPVR